MLPVIAFFNKNTPVDFSFGFHKHIAAIVRSVDHALLLHVNASATQRSKVEKEFVFWDLPQIQYKNPQVQISTFKNMTPTPFIRAFYDRVKNIFIKAVCSDVEGKVEHNSSLSSRIWVVVDGGTEGHLGFLVAVCSISSSDTGDHMLVDVDGISKEEIYAHLIKVIGKDEIVLKAELLAKEKKDNPANFGTGCDKHCICEIPGQIPCSGLCPLPKHMRGKYINKKNDDD